MWPSEFIELKQIEDLLQCGICYEYMETSVITPCSHNYCSLCIRKYLHYETQCPACFEETFEKDLRVNKVVDEIILYFTRVKKKLLKCVCKNGGEADKNDNIDVLNTSSFNQQSNIDVKIKCSDKESEKNSENSTVDSIVASPSTTKIPVSEESSPSTSATSKVAAIFTPKNKKNQKVVACPVCKVNVSETTINRHLDDCLKREEKKDRPKKTETKRKPLSKLVFRLMKDTEIRRKLKEFGLATQGDRKALEIRLQRYITLYNAECDKQDPRPISELIKQCEEDELLESKIHKTPSTTKRLQINRNTAQNVIEEERRKYLEVYKDSFEDLIKKVKSTKCSTKESSPKCTVLDKDIHNKIIQHISPKQENMNDSWSSDDIKMSDCHQLGIDTDSQDSSSNTICPLQIYSSEDPRNFLTAELSSSPNEKTDKTNSIFRKESSNVINSKVLISQEHNETCYPIYTDRRDARNNKSLSHPAIDKIDILHDENAIIECNKNYTDRPIVHSTHFSTKQCLPERYNLLNDIEQNDSRRTLNILKNDSKGKPTLQMSEKLRRSKQISSTDSLSSYTVTPKKLGKMIGVERLLSSDIEEYIYDLSSNDSIEQKYSHELSKQNMQTVIDDDIENENLLSQRKRNHDFADNDRKLIKKKRSAKKSLTFYDDNLKDSDNIEVMINNNKNDNLQRTSTKEVLMGPKKSLRKSVRTKSTKQSSKVV